MAVRGTLPDRYTCECEDEHVFPSYVYAHWDTELTHTCGTCGRKNILHRGKVTYGVRPTKNKD